MSANENESPKIVEVTQSSDFAVRVSVTTTVFRSSRIVAFDDPFAIGEAVRQALIGRVVGAPWNIEGEGSH